MNELIWYEHLALLPILIVLVFVVWLFRRLFSKSTSDEIAEDVLKKGVVAFVGAGVIFWATFESMYWFIKILFL